MNSFRSESESDVQNWVEMRLACVQHLITLGISLTIILGLIITSSKVKTNCKRLGVNNCGPKCIEKTTPYIYSIFKMTRNFLLNHLWWWIYVRFENCEITIYSQTVVPEPSPPAKWRFDWEIGRIWDILASPCTKISHSSFNILLHLIYLGPLQNIVAIILLY